MRLCNHEEIITRTACQRKKNSSGRELILSVYVKVTEDIHIINGKIFMLPEIRYMNNFEQFCFQYKIISQCKHIEN